MLREQSTTVVKRGISRLVANGVTGALLLTTVVTWMGCNRKSGEGADSIANLIPACRMAIAAESRDSNLDGVQGAGDASGNLDRDIAQQQQLVRQGLQIPAGSVSGKDSNRALEQLGWMFVEKARRSFDSGYYKLAEACAECLDSKRPGGAEALLIRGHALNSLHRFSEAETVARQLVSMRGLHLDFGLLGDSLMEQGKLDDAIQAYQQMIDLKPGPHSYARAAHVRWLKGDLEGAIEMMKRASRSVGPREAEAAAWNYSRLAFYEFQAGELKTALLIADAGLALQPDYAPALLVRGRVLLASGRSGEAVEVLRSAARQNPLPEYQWTLAEALKVSGDVAGASAVEAELRQGGAASDPRTFALYLATSGESLDTALTLAQDELKVRRDVFTLDAAAWVMAANGRTSEARDLMRLAVAEGTSDARLFYHAGSIASLDGDRLEAKKWLVRADRLKQMLLPSERDRLKLLLAKV